MATGQSLIKTKELPLPEKVYLHLFDDEKVASQFLTENEMKIKKRWSAIYSYMLDNPYLSTSDIVTFILTGGVGAFEPVSKSQAYRDIEVIQNYLGNIKNATKVWVRHIVYNACVETIQDAQKKKDFKAIVMAADKLGKYFKLDKEDVDPLDWEKIIPPSFEPTDDVTVLGIKKTENIEQRRRELRAKFKGSSENDILDAEVLDDE